MELRQTSWFVLSLALAISGCASSHNNGKSPADGSTDDGGGKDAGPVKGTGGKGGTGGTGGKGGSDAGTPTACGTLTCMAPSTCDKTGATPACVCPKGYKPSTTGNTVSCTDVNECANASMNDCDPNATCANKDGGFACTCNGPAWSGDGKTCTCASGYVDVSGDCKASDGTACGADTDCKNSHCVSSICCATACDSPTGACKTATGATCADGSACAYPNATDGTGCNDGDACTTVDTCSGGSCTGTDAPNCDDGNICTADTCDHTSGCVNDGRSVPNTTECQTATSCNMYLCNGQQNGVCEAHALVDCSGLNTQCAVGVCMGSGTCMAVAANDGLDCDDGDPCTLGEKCNATACTGGTAATCNDGNPCTDDVCVARVGCQGNVNTAPCDDGNPCTVTDQCGSGACQPGSLKNCSDQDDPCNTGVCNSSGGNCEKSPKASSTACDDGNLCSASSTCNNGSCPYNGQIDGCGPGGLTCSGGASSIACTCDTAANYHQSGGVCVPNTDECASAPCVTSPVAPICADPSPASGDYTCPCPAGYDGDGKKTGTGCTNHNDCANNPCVNGTCTDGVNSYSCSCSSTGTIGSFISVDATNDGKPVCVCNMTGTFAVRLTTPVSWTPVSVSGIQVIDGGSETTYSWAIRRMTYDSSGNLSGTIIPCGATTPDLCGDGVSFFSIPKEAYAEFVSNQAWGTGNACQCQGTCPASCTSCPNKASASIPSFSLPTPYVGQAYNEPLTAQLLGISLTDALNGQWPADRTHVGGGGGTQTNGAVWVDHDGDCNTAVTTYAAPPGGIGIDGSIPDPPYAYPSSSTACPRGSSATRLPYAYPPQNDSSCTGSVCRVDKLFAASRVISQIKGSFTDCDNISGSVVGKNGGNVTNELRVADCTDDSPDKKCSTATVNGLDTTPQNQTITNATFVMKRLSNDANFAVTCDHIRLTDLPKPP